MNLWRGHRVQGNIDDSFAAAHDAFANRTERRLTDATQEGPTAERGKTTTILSDSANMFDGLANCSLCEAYIAWQPPVLMPNCAGRD